MVAHHLLRAKEALADLREDLLRSLRFKVALLRFRPTSSFCRTASRRRDSRHSTLRAHRSLIKLHSKRPEKSTRSSSAGAFRKRLPTTS
jgi:hypothetical protein